VPELYEYAMQPEHLRSVGDDSVDNTTITYSGALSVNSGKKSGRVPKEKRIVYDELTKDVSNFG
jgi:ATP-dependent phosphoenolpyruvate carboxykinase